MAKLSEKAKTTLRVATLLCSAHSGGEVTSPCGACQFNAQRLVREGFDAILPKKHHVSRVISGSTTEEA